MKNKFVVEVFAICFGFAFALAVYKNVFAGNDWINGELRVDLSAIRTAADYKVSITATALPSNTGTTDFTSGWLSVNLNTPETCYKGCFTQVGLMTMEDGLHWFAYTEDPDGITCWRGTPKWGSKGCLGAVGDLVSLNTWHIVQLAGYPLLGHWVARVYDTYGNPHDVAKITNSSNTIYRATVQFEEGYSDTGNPDPYYLGRFFFYYPQYKSGSVFQDWPQSVVPVYDITRTNYVWTPSNPPHTICPSKYGARLNLNGDPRFWFAGTSNTYPGGIKCDWWLFPPVVSAGTYDNPLTSSLIYQRTINGILNTGNWTHSSGWPRTYGNTLSYTSTQNDKVTLTFTGSRITRLYTMAYNHVLAEVFIDGYSLGQQNDYASTALWQVGKTWPVSSGTHTIEVKKIGGSGYVDLDAFIVDVPYASSGSYDDTHSYNKYIGSWTAGCCWPWPWNQTLHWSNNTEDAVTFTFSGNSITYVYTKFPNRGKAVITIDGVYKELLDTYSATAQWQVQKTYSNLGSGIHTIHISASGLKNPSSSDYYIDVDRFIVP